MYNIRSFEQRPAGSATMSSEMLYAQNYYRWTVAQFTEYFGDNILDIGGGYGSHLEFILPEHPHVISAELSEDSVMYMNQRFHDYPNFEAIQVDFGKNDIQMLTEKKFDTITCFNVLEHIEDDYAALKDMQSILKPHHGTLCLQVPAHPWLYGSLDEQAGHYRRYTIDDVKEKLDKTGYDPIKVYYFNIFGVLPWFISARLLKRPLEAGSVNFQVKVFNALVPVFSRVENILRLPIGQSIMAIATVK